MVVVRRFSAWVLEGHDTMNVSEHHRKILPITVLLLVLSQGAMTAYRVGVGIADVTGPAAEIGMVYWGDSIGSTGMSLPGFLYFDYQMGYAKQQQKTSGIHTRLYSRAFIFDDGQKKMVFVSADVCMIGHLVKKAVRHFRPDHPDTGCT